MRRSEINPASGQEVTAGRKAGANTYQNRDEEKRGRRSIGIRPAGAGGRSDGLTPVV